MRPTPKLILCISLTILMLACNLPFAVSPTQSPMPVATNTRIVTLTPVATSTPLPTPTAVPMPVPIYQLVWLESVDYEESGQDPTYTLTTHTPTLRSDDEVQQVQNFNALTAAFVQQEIDSFKEMLSKMPGESPLAGSFYEVSFTQVSPVGNLISLQFVVDGYTAGAAHPFRVISSFTYDLDAGQEVQLEQLFTPGASYLQTISQYCVDELSSRDIGAWLDGAAPRPENYTVWNITADGLLITFNEYQVASYAAGAQTVVVPYTELQDILAPGILP
jgi:hypothetical protein